MEHSPASTYISSRRIGDATVTIVLEGSCLWAPRFQVPDEVARQAMPDADPQGRIRIAFNVAHIALPGASVLVDPGFDEPASAWNHAFGSRWPEYARTPGLMTALATMGVSPGGVTHVVITHAHDDHFAGVAVEQAGGYAPRFPRARHYIGRQDWEGNPRRHEPDSELANRLGAVERTGALELVDDEHDVAPGVSMIHTPGETAGHCVVRVRSGEGTFLYAGDLFHHACEVEHPEWVPPNRDPAIARASRERFIAGAAGATVVFSHGPFPGWGRIVRRGEGYCWERIA
jgi:glyoxylase-like metal-dependent hydrolase (beta-lactamase superfamily II)